MRNSTDLAKGVYYGDYLRIPSLLSLQKPKSGEEGHEVHDETLFIIVHQVYELWFKQIIHELQSVRAFFNQKSIEEEEVAMAVHRLERVNRIQKILNDQLAVIKTMTPMDFLEFRNLLLPASGFQSVQFRRIEIILGVDHAMVPFRESLSCEDREAVNGEQEQPSLLVLLDRWLSRTPFLQEEGFDFWRDYRREVEKMLGEEQAMIEGFSSSLSHEQREVQKKSLSTTRQTFESLFDGEMYERHLKEGGRRLSQRGALGALFIFLYREQPVLSMPYRFLNTLVAVDEEFTAWRYNHALMAHRMLGKKVGTGGSSGHNYLKTVVDSSRVFTDLFDLSSFFIPKSKLPHLPEKLKKRLSFYGQY